MAAALHILDDKRWMQAHAACQLHACLLRMVPDERTPAESNAYNFLALTTDLLDNIIEHPDYFIVRMSYKPVLQLAHKVWTHYN